MRLAALIRDLRKAVDGRKTYIAVAVGLVYIFGGDQGWWRVSAEMIALLNLLGLGALRSGVAKSTQTPPTPPTA